MEEKKNNKGLVWLIVILIFLVLGLVGYIVYDKVLLDSDEKNNVTNTTTTAIENNNINKETIITSEELVCDSNDKCQIKSQGNIKISIEKIVNEEYTHEYYYLLYFNDNAIENGDKLENTSISKIILLDDNYIFVEYNDLIGEASNLYYIYNTNGSVIYDMTKQTSLKDVALQNITYENKAFIINSTNYLGDYAFTVCQYNKDDIVASTEKIKYLGNGKLSESEIVSSKTSDQVIHERYNMSCEEIKNSTSEDLEYARENIKSYENN